MSLGAELRNSRREASARASFFAATERTLSFGPRADSQRVVGRRLRSSVAANSPALLLGAMCGLGPA